MKGFWTCQRVSGGVKCQQRNANRKRKCTRCQKPRPPRQRPAHLSALALSYEFYVTLNGGEFCALCGAKPKPGRKLNRDHTHEGVGIPRGLLCWRHNKFLLHRDVTVEFLERTIAYLKRADVLQAGACPNREENHAD